MSYVAIRISCTNVFVVSAMVKVAIITIVNEAMVCHTPSPR